MKKTQKKERVFILRTCPECKSDELGIVIGTEGRKKDWECKKCRWIGKGPEERKLTEEEFMDYSLRKEAEMS